MPRGLIHEPEERMTREDYRAWAEQQPSHRFERIEGVVVAMAPIASGDIALDPPGLTLAFADFYAD